MCLLNVFASEMLGTNYLHKNIKLIPKLTEILYKEKEDTNLRQNTLGTLQKLSLRKDPQTMMIKLNLISWIIGLLQREGDTISEYTLEYATALLMNLALRTAGKQKCAEQKEEILRVLDKLLETENMQVRTYINGTLYSILTIPTLKEQAKAIGLDKRLEVMFDEDKCEDRLKNQIDYILTQLKNEKEVECLSDDNEDLQENEEDEDYETEEEDEIDNEICKNNIPVGESLLISEFIDNSDNAKEMSEQLMKDLVMGAIPSKQVGDTIKKIDDNIPIAQRPKTPHLSSTKTAQIPISQLNQNTMPEQRVPNELESKPKIPSTPVNLEPHENASIPEAPQIMPADQNEEKENRNDTVQSGHQNIENKQEPVIKEEGPLVNEEEYKESIKKIIDGATPDLTATKAKFFVFQSRPKLVRSPKGSGHHESTKVTEEVKTESRYEPVKKPKKKK